MVFKFEELKIWQISLLLSDEIDNLAKRQFPKIELFSLTTQIKKAADCKPKYSRRLYGSIQCRV
ncbi:four helix bundle protein [Pedobacter sp. UBA4863]|uniref:four helix bundle protein n=1 Tax=uncultured Pedobacter sp. TaxID=246139 RepID=UPI0025CFAC46|nr:four helix bundle protein [Pedobacter sp. UBA4863]